MAITLCISLPAVQQRLSRTKKRLAKAVATIEAKEEAAKGGQL